MNLPFSNLKNNGASDQSAAPFSYGFDNLESQAGYSPFYRSIGLLAVGGVGYMAHTQYLRTSAAYAPNLYRWARRFEDLTPNKLGATLGMSERAASYVVGDLHFHRSTLVSNGQLTELGEHFQRVLGTKVDVSKIGASGLHFKRREQGSPFLDLEGFEGVQVRFTKTGGRYAGSSFRYNRPLEDQPFHWSGEANPFKRTWQNFRQAEHSQAPWSPKQGAWDKQVKENFSPWYSRYEAEEDAGIAEEVKTGFSNFSRAINPQFLELFERPQKMLAEIGLGLRQGSYNKVFHIPGLGEGGMLNGILLRRVLPIAVGLTAARYLDYKLDHKPSNTIVDLGLKANVFRADLTDTLPGARKVTDSYAEVVPGPQYGPIALPLAGAFAGGMIHMGQVAFTKKFAGEDRIARSFRHAEGKVLPDIGLIKRAMTAEGSVAKIKALWGSLGTPGKGLAIGLAAMLPFIPGMLGSRKTGAELRRTYSGEEDVPVRQGRWWEVGSSKFSGGRIISWRPHGSVLYKNRAKVKSLYGSEEEYWKHNPILHPLRWLKDPYYLERLHYKDRPYPITSPAFSNVPLIGPLLAATIGKVVKPVIRMHDSEKDDSNYTLYSKRLEPKGPQALPVSKPKEEFSLWHSIKLEVRTMAEYVGLPGFIMKSAALAAFPEQQHGQNVYLQGSRQMDSWSRQYYEQNLGAGMFASPEPDNGMTGYTEPLRRFIQHEGFVPQVNEVANTMPSWMPGENAMIDFKKGDPFTKLDEGWARLPGKGYEALHPEVKGIDPEDYPDLTKLEILGDIAPYSREYQKYRAIVEHRAEHNPDLLESYERIVAQVKETKDSTLQVDTRHFNAPVEQIEGTVTKATAHGIHLAEYPGQVFHFSSISSSMADLVADTLGESNRITRAEAVRSSSKKLEERNQYLSQRLTAGTSVRMTIAKGNADDTQDVRAVVFVDGHNINRELIRHGYARFRKDKGGAEEQAMHGFLARKFGKYAESASFEGDDSVLNPLRYIPTPFHTKLWQERTAYSQYLQQEVTGTRMRRWDRPIHDFLSPYIRGTVERITGKTVVSKEAKHRRNLDTLVDMLSYLRALNQAENNPKARGRYTSQAKRTAIGSNLFGSSSYLASTLPSREARYFRKFVDETDPEIREHILEVAPKSTAEALKAQWAIRRQRIAEARGEKVEALGSEGRLYTEDQKAEYSKAKTKLGYGDWLRSKEISSFFFQHGFALPGEDSDALNENLDYQDVKLKIVQQEGYDAHDFNLFDDRSSVLWRKPYIDGAVRELTSGDGRTQEQMRQAIESMMLAVGNKNPDVRVTSQAAPRSRANVRVDADTDHEAYIEQDMRRNKENYS